MQSGRETGVALGCREQAQSAVYPPNLDTLPRPANCAQPTGSHPRECVVHALLSSTHVFCGNHCLQSCNPNVPHGAAECHPSTSLDLSCTTDTYELLPYISHAFMPLYIQCARPSPNYLIELVSEPLLRFAVEHRQEVALSTAALLKGRTYATMRLVWVAVRAWVNVRGHQRSVRDGVRRG